MIEVHDLSKSSGGKLVVDRLSFTLEPGRVSTIQSQRHLK